MNDMHYLYDFTSKGVFQASYPNLKAYFNSTIYIDLHIWARTYKLKRMKSLCTLEFEEKYNNYHFCVCVGNFSLIFLPCDTDLEQWSYRVSNAGISAEQIST